MQTYKTGSSIREDHKKHIKEIHDFTWGILLYLKTFKSFAGYSFPEDVQKKKVDKSIFYNPSITEEQSIKFQAFLRTVGEFHLFYESRVNA